MKDQEQRFGTGWMQTRIVPDGAATWSWHHRPGPARPGAIPVPSPEDAAVYESASTTSVALRCPRRAEDGTVWSQLPGPASLAQLLYDENVPSSADRLMADAAGALRLLHERSGAAVTVPPDTMPPGPARLAHWIHDGSGPGGAQVLHRNACRALGRHRLAQLADWCRELGKDDSTPLHGNLTLGGLVVPVRPDQRAVVLTGEDTCRGPKEFDLGWPVGELYEYHCLARAAGRERPELASARDAFLTGYDAPADEETVARTAVLRLAVHTHDIAAFRGWTTELFLYLTFLARAVDEPADTLGDWKGA